MLKTLVKHQRPFVIFDPKNTEHRTLYYRFLKTQSWKHSPYQWAIDDDSLDVIHSIQKKLIDYYTALEFKSVAKKQQKNTKTVDKKVLKINDLQSQKKVAK